MSSSSQAKKAPHQGSLKNEFYSSFCSDRAGVGNLLMDRASLSLHSELNPVACGFISYFFLLLRIAGTSFKSPLSPSTKCM